MLAKFKKYQIMGFISLLSIFSPMAWANSLIAPCSTKQLTIAPIVKIAPGMMQQTTIYGIFNRSDSICQLHGDFIIHVPNNPEVSFSRYSLPTMTIPHRGLTMPIDALAWFKITSDAAHQPGDRGYLNSFDHLIISINQKPVNVPFHAYNTAIDTITSIQVGIPQGLSQQGCTNQHHLTPVSLPAMLGPNANWVCS